MSASLVTLERELERAAIDFASALVLAALRAKVEELPLLRHNPAPLTAEQFPVDLVRAPTRAPSRAPSRAVRAAPEPPVRVAKAISERKAKTPRRAKPDEAESDDGGHTITDPSLLLAALEFDAQPSSRARPSRSTDFVSSPVEDTGPALRPGERIERSAGGTVILRRGRG
jgi:hypothetical protein